MDNDDRAYELEQKGLEANSVDDNELAAKYFKELTELDPDYENGAIFAHLGLAYDLLGREDEAEKAYLKSLEYDPEDHYRLGNYAAFVSAYKGAEQGFYIYLKLLKLYKMIRWPERIEHVSRVLFSKGAELGWSKEKVQKAIDES